MNRIGVFLSGVVTASAVGYYNIHQDVWKTTSVLDKEIKTAKEIISKQNLELEINQKKNQEKISELEHNMLIYRTVLEEIYNDVSKLKKLAAEMDKEDH